MGSTPEGTICQKAQARGMKKALVKMADYVEQETENAREKVLAISHCNCEQRAKDFEKISGRKYGLIEEYKMDDAEYAMVIIGSAAGTAKEAVDEMREAGKKVGIIKIRSFRPFPGEEIATSLKKCKAVAVMDRCESFSTNGGPVGAETMQAMYTNGCTAKAINIMYGIGGRDVTVGDMRGVYDTLEEIACDIIRLHALYNNKSLCRRCCYCNGGGQGFAAKIAEPHCDCHTWQWPI